MKNDNCIFCKLANGEIPSSTLYEDSDFRVILDLAPSSKGHALILPKDHFSDLHELNEETASKVLPLAQKLMNKMKKALNCDGFNILQNNGECAGQSVFHFHMHVIPRYKDDQVKLGFAPHDTTKEELAEVVRLVKELE